MVENTRKRLTIGSRKKENGEITTAILPKVKADRNRRKPANLIPAMFRTKSSPGRESNPRPALTRETRYPPS